MRVEAGRQCCPCKAVGGVLRDFRVRAVVNGARPGAVSALVFSSERDQGAPQPIVKTILLIDDDRSLHHTLAAPLEQAGWSVARANGGEEGVSRALEELPEVVVCDLLMPGYNGYQVCRTLHSKREALPNTKIIATSGSAYQTDRLNALEAGADEFLTKPIRPVDLLKVIADISGNSTRIFANNTAASLKKVEPPPAEGPLSYLIGRPPTLRFWGVRGSIPTPGEDTLKYGGNTACVELRADGEILILDAGSGIRQLGRKLTTEYKDLPIHVTLLISHTHWDHIQGFPFFIPAYNPKNQVRIIGYEGARKGLSSTLQSQMESPYFPISMQQMPGHLAVEELKNFEFLIGAVKVQATFLNHPGICVGYRFNTSGGSVCYVPDNEPYSRLRTLPTHSETHSYELLSFAQKQDEKFIEFIRGADILIMDAQYDAAEYESHVGWGHGCVDDVVGLAVIAGVRHLFLFHHDPDHDDAQIDRMVEWARDLAEMHGSTMTVDAAREGLELALDFLTPPPVQQHSGAQR